MPHEFFSLTRALAEAVRRQRKHAMASVLGVVAVVELKGIALHLMRTPFIANLRKRDANDACEREKNDETQLRHDVS